MKLTSIGSFLLLALSTVAMAAPVTELNTAGALFKNGECKGMHSVPYLLLPHPLHKVSVLIKYTPARNWNKVQAAHGVLHMALP